MKNRILVILNAVLWLAFLLLMLTGLIMKFRISPEDGTDLMWHGIKYQEMGEFHFFIACTVISLIAGHIWLNKAWLSMWFKRKRNTFILVAVIGILIPLVAFAEPTSEELSGSYAATGSVTTLDAPITSLGHRVDITYKPISLDGRFDYRAETYTETSFHGIENSLINEHKFETQLMYSSPLNSIISASGGLLYHENYTFPDTYFWAIASITASAALTEKVSISASLSAERKTDGGRIFYDSSGTINYQFNSLSKFFSSVHRYENLGQFDSFPTQKLEYEIGASHALSSSFNITLSYLHHSQYSDPNDRFSCVKLRFGVNF